MFRKIFLGMLSLWLVSCQHKNEKVNSYPFIESLSHTDIYHGISVEDPYRNLENLNDTIVLNWFKEQEGYAKKRLSSIPGRDQLLLDQLEFDKRRTSNSSKIRIKKNGNIFYLKRRKGENFNKLYFKKDLKASEELIYDPSNYGADYIIRYFKASWDSKRVAISLGKKGENISEIVILNLVDKSIDSNVIKNVAPDIAGGINWLPNNSGFIYQFIPNTDHKSKEYLLNTKAVLYNLGSDPSKFVDIFSSDSNNINLEPADFPIVVIKSDSSKFIFGKISGVSSYKDYYIAEINNNTDYLQLKWEPLFKKEEQIKDFAVYKDDIIYRTSKNASNFKICKTSLYNPNFNNPTILVEEIADKVITDFEYVKGELFYITMKNGIEAKFNSHKNSKIEEIKLPLVAGNSYVSYQGETLMVSVNSWTKPRQSYKFDIDKRKFTLIDLDTKASFPEFDDLVVKELEVPSHDGVMIPLSIIHRKGLKKDGNNRLISLSYGAYGASFSPFFSIPSLTWVNNGGIWVVPHVRGGGEKGDDWHKSGFKSTKFNSWKDLIACSEYLIKEGYTSKDKNIAFGVSAAGITIGRAITERPDLFGAVVMNFPALNMLRCEFQPNGPNSIKEFGTVKDSIEFRALYNMDAYHHIEKAVDYPPILISTGMKDGNVVPWDPAKFVVRMQSSNPQGKPTLFKVDFEANHGGTGTTNDYYENMVDTFSFALWQTGHPDYQPY